MNPAGDDGQIEPPRRQFRKQARRRLQANRPFKERFVNMAEARREIVAALKFHRESMKQASKQEPSPLRQPGKIKSRTKPRSTCISTTSSFSDNVLGFPRLPLSFSWCAPFLPRIVFENGDFSSASLPTQTLGLNLNLRSLVHGNNPLPADSSSSYSSQVSPPAASDARESSANSSLHLEVDDEATRVVSPEMISDVDAYHNQLFDQVTEFPTWLNPTDGCFPLVDDCFFTHSSSNDPSLPCMDIEEIDGIDWEWLG